MTKLAIYGDSFGYEKSIFYDDRKIDETLVGKSWVSMLRQDYDITNFCIPGSDLYYSFREFKNNYKKFDVNIFLITNKGRFSFQFNNRWIHSHNINSAELKLSNAKGLEKDAINASIEYFKFLQDDIKDEYLNNLMVKELLLLDKDILLIDCFGPNGLNNITQMENTEWEFPSNYSKRERFIDLRYSHLTKENNCIVYQNVKTCIDNKTNFKFNITDYIKPSKDDKSKYVITN